MQFTKALQNTIVWKILNTTLSLFINLLMIRIMGAAYSGEFFYAITTLSLCVLLLSGSLESGIIYYGSQSEINIPALSFFLLPWLLLQALMAYKVMQFLPIGLYRPLSWVFVIANVAIIYFSALFYTRKWFLFLNLIIAFVNAALVIILCCVYARYGGEFGKLLNHEKLQGDHIIITHLTGDKQGQKGIYYAGFAFISGFALQALLLFAYFYMRLDFKIFSFTLSRPLLKKVLRFSAVAFVSNVIFFMVSRLDYFYVERYCNPIALSNYMQVSKIGQLLVLIPTMIATVIFPYSSGAAEGEYLPQLQSVCRTVSVFFMPAALLLIVSGYWLFPWLFGEGFGQMYQAILYYLPGFYALSMVTLLASFLAGRAKLSVNLVGSLLALIVIATGDVLLIPLLGINAAAAVSSVGYFACGIYQLRYYKRTFNCSITDFFVPRKNELIDLFMHFKKMITI